VKRRRGGVTRKGLTLKTKRRLILGSGRQSGRRGKRRGKGARKGDRVHASASSLSSLSFPTEGVRKRENRERATI